MSFPSHRVLDGPGDVGDGGKETLLTVGARADTQFKRPRLLWPNKLVDCLFLFSCDWLLQEAQDRLIAFGRQKENVNGRGGGCCCYCMSLLIGFASRALTVFFGGARGVMRLTYPQLARGLLLALALFAGRWCQDLERIKVPVPSCGPSSTLWTGGACAVCPISWYSYTTK